MILPKVDLIQPVIGFRSWRCINNSLYSTGLGRYEWKPGKNTSDCRANSITTLRWKLLENQAQERFPHRAPGHRCDCGFYIMHTLAHAQAAVNPFVGGGLAYGAVAVWGNLEVHSTGIRAQYARIVALAYDSEDLQARQRLAAAYSVPLVKMTDLEEVGFRYGIKTPTEYVPDCETVKVWIQFHLDHPGSAGGKNILPVPRQGIHLNLLNHGTAISLPPHCKYLTLWTAVEKGFLLSAWFISSTEVGHATGVETILLPPETKVVMTRGGEEKKVIERIDHEPFRVSLWGFCLFTFTYIPSVIGLAFLFPLNNIFLILLRTAIVWIVCRRIAKWGAKRIA